MAREMICCSRSSPESYSNRQALGQMRGLWYSLFRTSIYQNFSASWPRFFVHYGRSNSSRDTDPSALSSLSCCSWMCLWCSFLLGFSCVKRLKLARRRQRGETDRFSSFRLVASPDIVWTTWWGTFPHSLWQTFWGWLVWFWR